MEHHPPQGGELRTTLEHPRWPKYIGALALDAWLSRVAEYGDQEPSVELYIAQYRDEDVEQAEPDETINPEPIQPIPLQLPLHLQWGGERTPTDLSERPLTPEDADATRRLLATTVDVLAGRTSLFALYVHLQPNAYAAMDTRLRMGTRLPRHAELCSIHGQYPAKGVIEACGIARYGLTARALAARLERRRRRWVGSVLRVV